MVTTLQVGKDDRETLRAEYERLTALGIDVEDAYRVDYIAGWVKVYRYDLRDGRRYVAPGTEHLNRPRLAVAEPTWHRVTS